MTFSVTDILGKSTVKSISLTIPGKEADYSINGKDFDCVVDTSSVFRRVVTRNPIQFDTAITDNMIKEPLSFTLRGVLSEYTSILGGLVEAGASLPGGSKSNNATNWYRHFTELYELKNGGTITLNMYPGVYNNLVVENMIFTGDAIKGLGLGYTITLTEIITAPKSVSSSSNRTSNPANSANTGTTNNGRTQATSVKNSEVH